MQTCALLAVGLLTSVHVTACRTHAFQQPISYQLYSPRRSHRVPDGTDIRATLAKLQANFDLADAVIEALEKSQLKNLEEFRFVFDSEAEIGVWTARLKLGDQEQLQVARLRRTWSAVKLFYQHAEQDRSNIQASDLETLLGDTELRNIKTALWARYRVRFHPEMYPSDATLSRISRELSKRMLCVFSVWKVKSLQFQPVELPRQTPDSPLGIRPGRRPSAILSPRRCAGAHLGSRHHAVRRGAIGYPDKILSEGEANNVPAPYR